MLLVSIYILNKRNVTWMYIKYLTIWLGLLTTLFFLSIATNCQNSVDYNYIKVGHPWSMLHEFCTVIIVCFDLNIY